MIISASLPIFLPYVIAAVVIILILWRLVHVFGWFKFDRKRFGKLSHRRIMIKHSLNFRGTALMIITVAILAILLIVSIYMLAELGFGEKLWAQMLFLSLFIAFGTFASFLISIPIHLYNLVAYKDYRHLVRGNAFLFQENEIDAIKEFQKAVEIEPSEYAYFRLASVKHKMLSSSNEDIDYLEVDSLYSKAIESDLPYYYSYLCRSDLRKEYFNDYEGALLDAKQGMKLEKLQINNTCKESFRKIISIYSEKGKQNLMNGNYEQAAIDFEHLLNELFTDHTEWMSFEYIGRKLEILLWKESFRTKRYRHLNTETIYLIALTQFRIGNQVESIHYFKNYLLIRFGGISTCFKFGFQGLQLCCTEFYDSIHFLILILSFYGDLNDLTKFFLSKKARFEFRRPTADKKNSLVTVQDILSYINHRSEKYNKDKHRIKNIVSSYTNNDSEFDYGQFEDGNDLFWILEYYFVNAQYEEAYKLIVAANLKNEHTGMIGLINREVQSVLSHQSTAPVNV